MANNVKVFFINDVEDGLLYSNFIVKDGIPKIITWAGAQKGVWETELVDTEKFHDVAEEVLKKLIVDRRVMIIGPRGIGKSVITAYVAWRSLLGGLDNVVLDKPIDAIIHVDSLSPGDASSLNNLIESESKRFLLIYDPSPIEAYYKPEAMRVVRWRRGNTALRELIEDIKNTLKELIEVRNAWTIIVLPDDLHVLIQRESKGDAGLRHALNDLLRDVTVVNLRDEGFLREIIKTYSGCDNVNDILVKISMGFDAYTITAKYIGLVLRESGCNVEDIKKVLNESVSNVKLFFANYIWGILLGQNMDLARRVSVPLILYASFGPIPESITYSTKAVNDGGVWKIIARDRAASSKLDDLKEDDLEPIAIWLSSIHEDLIGETLRELAGMRGEEVRANYRVHGLGDLIDALDWGHREALGMVRELNQLLEEQ